jgi:hypothetical protein
LSSTTMNASAGADAAASGDHDRVVVKGIGQLFEASIHAG